MKSSATITIKELHAHTGAHVRRAAKFPIRVTDRGELVAVLAGPHLVPAERRKRNLLPEYAALLKLKPSHDVLEDLGTVRGDR
jgi:antitoxin (DNA-binding transcriptional repressor) of toxin-antitoxin stability system